MVDEVLLKKALRDRLLRDRVLCDRALSDRGRKSFDHFRFKESSMCLARVAQLKRFQEELIHMENTTDEERDLVEGNIFRILSGAEKEGQ